MYSTQHSIEWRDDGNKNKVGRGMEKAVAKVSSGCELAHLALSAPTICVIQICCRE